MAKLKRTFIGIIICICIGAVGLLALLAINGHIKRTVKDRIVESDNLPEEDMDCILVLGCQVKEGGEPSHMLRDRLQRGVEVYDFGASDKLLMSGDHGRTDYNEVKTMKQYAVDEGVNSENVFMDHAGFSTYESIYRAKEVFGVKKMIIVTQKYHLYRALYIAEQLGIEAYGFFIFPLSATILYFLSSLSFFFFSTYDFALVLIFARISFNLPSVFSSFGKRRFIKNMAIAKVTIFSGDGRYRNAIYAPETAIIHFISSAVPTAIITYDHPLVIIHAMPKHNSRRGFKINSSAFFMNLFTFFFIFHELPT